MPSSAPQVHFTDYKIADLELAVEQLDALRKRSKGR